MTLTNARASIGLNATATATSTEVSGSVRVGAAVAPVSFPDADVAYTVRAILATSGDVLTINTTTGSTTGSTTFVAGSQQIETATIVAAAGCTLDGTMTLVLTNAGLAGSPLNVPVSLAYATDTTADLIATAARAALSAVPAIAARFTISGTGANIILSRVKTDFTVPGGTMSVCNAADATLNLAIPAGLGVTAAASSVPTAAGAATTGAKIYDSATDFEGVTIPTITIFNGILIKNDYTAAATVTGSTNDVHTVAAYSQALFIGSDGYAPAIETTQNITAAGLTDIYVTVIGQTA